MGGAIGSDSFSRYLKVSVTDVYKLLYDFNADWHRKGFRLLATDDNANYGEYVCSAYRSAGNIHTSIRKIGGSFSLINFYSKNNEVFMKPVWNAGTNYAVHISSINKPIPVSVTIDDTYTPITIKT